MKRDYESAPLSNKLRLDDVIKGLCADLDALRAGRIGVQDAIARSLLAKQIFNGARIYLNATKFLAAEAAEIGDGPAATGSLCRQRSYTQAE